MVISIPCDTPILLLRFVAHWRYASEGRIEIDNNAAERALRSVALGRKNFLFAGSDAGGERAAAIYSLVGSAKLNGLDPEAYLRFIIERIADYRISELDDLLLQSHSKAGPFGVSFTSRFQAEISC